MHVFRVFTRTSLFVLGLVILCLVIFSLLFFGCQYQCNQLPGKTRPKNDLLCVEWDVKPYTLIHTHSTECTILLIYSPDIMLLLLHLSWVATYIVIVYSPVNKNPQFFRQRSLDKKPSLPRDGAQKMAKQISNMKNPSSQEFLKTPDAGVSGYVEFEFALTNINAMCVSYRYCVILLACL